MHRVYSLAKMSSVLSPIQQNFECAGVSVDLIPTVMRIALSLSWTAAGLVIPGLALQRDVADP
eukprot:scaffold98819_cov29-Tisochrysis_lutea.AAC.3